MLAEAEEKSKFKVVLDRFSRWLGSSEAHTAEVSSGDEAPSHTEALQEEPSLDPAVMEIRPIARSIAERLSSLKTILEFEPGLLTALEQARTQRQLLAYIHEVLLFKFIKLLDIGILNPQSTKVLDVLNEKIGAALAGRLSEADSDDDLDPGELLRENNELKKQLELLTSRYVKTGIITDTELTQEKEIKYLQSRVRVQHNQLLLARKKMKLLVSFQEMIQSLKAKNSLLNSKVEHQSKLLRSFAAENPKHQKLVSMVDKLSLENQRLKVDLQKQSDLLGQLKTSFPGDTFKLVEGLVDRNVHLHADMEKRQVQSDMAAGRGNPEDNLLEHIDRLTEENAHLKELLETKQSIGSFIKERKEGQGGGPEEIIEALNRENQRLEQRLKEEEFRLLASSGSDTPLIKAFTNVKNENRQLLKEIQLKEELLRQQQEEKKLLQSQIREKTSNIKDVQRLRAEADAGKRWMELLRKAEHQNRILKKERTEINSRYTRVVAELKDANLKVAKLTAEHGILIGEYEKIFGNR